MLSCPTPCNGENPPGLGQIVNQTVSHPLPRWKVVTDTEQKPPAPVSSGKAQAGHKESIKFVPPELATSGEGCWLVLAARGSMDHSCCRWWGQSNCPGPPNDWMPEPSSMETSEVVHACSERDTADTAGASPLPGVNCTSKWDLVAGYLRQDGQSEI